MSGLDFNANPEMPATHLRSMKAMMGLIQWRPGEDTKILQWNETFVSVVWVMRMREDFRKYLWEQKPKRHRGEDSDCPQHFLIVQNFAGMEESVQMVLDKCCEWRGQPGLISGRSAEVTDHGASSSSNNKVSWYMTSLPGS